MSCGLVANEYTMAPGSTMLNSAVCKHAIILLPRNRPNRLKQIAGEDDQQQANRRKNGGHTLLSLTHTGSWRHRLSPQCCRPIIFAALALPYVEVSARACSCRAHIRKASRKRWRSNASKRLKPVREMGLEPTRQRHRNLNPARLPIPPLARAYPRFHRCGRYAKP